MIVFNLNKETWDASSQLILYWATSTSIYCLRNDLKPCSNSNSKHVHITGFWHCMNTAFIFSNFIIHKWCVTQPEDNIDLEGLEKFAKEFKRRRIELGISCCYYVILSSLWCFDQFDHFLSSSCSKQNNL